MILFVPHSSLLPLSFISFLFVPHSLSCPSCPHSILFFLALILFLRALIPFYSFVRPFLCVPFLRAPIPFIPMSPFNEKDSKIDQSLWEFLSLGRRRRRWMFAWRHEWFQWCMGVFWRWGIFPWRHGWCWWIAGSSRLKDPIALKMKSPMLLPNLAWRSLL